MAPLDLASIIYVPDLINIYSKNYKNIYANIQYLFRIIIFDNWRCILYISQSTDPEIPIALQLLENKEIREVIINSKH